MSVVQCICCNKYSRTSICTVVMLVNMMIVTGVRASPDIDGFQNKNLLKDRSEEAAVRGHHQTVSAFDIH